MNSLEALSDLRNRADWYADQCSGIDGTYDELDNETTKLENIIKKDLEELRTIKEKVKKLIKLFNGKNTVLKAKQISDLLDEIQALLGGNDE